jgi:hypothetical protein
MTLKLRPSESAIMRPVSSPRLYRILHVNCSRNIGLRPVSLMVQGTGGRNRDVGGCTRSATGSGTNSGSAASVGLLMAEVINLTPCLDLN